MRSKLSLALMFVALVYAFLGGFHTVGDFDMRWHLATGRYVVQHHMVPSTDVLSYTSPGAEWLYPPFAGGLLYGIFVGLGYAGLSWFCALALMAIVACLLRHPSRRESISAAVLAIIAVPTLALRINPRPNIFTHLFFAIFLVLLWNLYASQGRFSEARPLVLTAIQLSIYPANEYMLLGVIDLAVQQPQSALADFDKAEEASGELRGVEMNRNLLAQIAEGRAEAYGELGDWQRAMESQQTAVRWAPADASAWTKLAAIYEKAGRNEQAERAREQARALSK